MTKISSISSSQKTKNETLETLIDSLTFLDTKYISRKAYNKLKGNIIKEYSEEQKKPF